MIDRLAVQNLLTLKLAIFASAQPVRLYALTNIPALLIGVFLVVAGAFGQVEPAP